MILRYINKILRLRGFEIIDKKNPLKERKASNDFVDDVVAEAKSRGLTVMGYIEKRSNIVGDTATVINKINELGYFKKSETILEIGAGTGRYIEVTNQIKIPYKNYIVYEIAKDWSKWLSENYNIIARDTDGNNLKHDKDNSVDLITAHGVFVYVPFLDAVRYYIEMARVVKPGGYIIFDVLSEKSFEAPYLSKWLVGKRTYPLFSSSEFVTKIFSENGCTFVNEFTAPIGDGIAHYLVYLKK
jgi:SAM-dependent methyltransferase